MTAGLRVRWLGRMEFADALALQEEVVTKKREDRSVGDELLLLEHEPVYTIGRTPDKSSLLGAARLLRRYGQDLHRYLRWLEQSLIELLADYGIAAVQRKGLTGVWIDHRKIASIGVGVRHWITMHGFALNVCGDLSPFNYIIPCGINNVAMTSMEKETGKAFSVVDVAVAFEKLAEHRIVDLRLAQEPPPVNA
jgi:lipoyl(octanoyl) transferase